MSQRLGSKMPGCVDTVGVDAGGGEEQDTISDEAADDDDDADDRDDACASARAFGPGAS